MGRAHLPVRAVAHPRQAVSVAFRSAKCDTPPSTERTPTVSRDRRLIHRLLLAFLVSGLSANSTSAASTVYAPSTVAQCRDQVQTWMTKRAVPQDKATAILDATLGSLAETASVTLRFEAVIAAFARADSETQLLVEAIAAVNESTTVEESALQSHHDEPFYLHNLRLLYARALTGWNRYDEALEIYSEIDPQYVVDPAGALFHRAVCETALLQKDAALASLDRLLHETEQTPARYVTLAELMQVDLEKLEEKSLDEVSRQMDDVRRRLGLGHAGQKVQRVEEKIITTLDELIKKAEQQQGGGGGGGGRGTPQSGKPNAAPESYLGEGKEGEGEVDPKNAGHKDRWGDLPEKAQAAAKNMLDQKYPAHYRQAIEKYLKKIAEREAPAAP